MSKTQHLLAVSNVAWKGQPHPPFLNLLKKEGASGVELAASLIWPEPIEATQTQRAEFRSLVEAQGLSIIGLHSLLFTRPDLNLLSDGLLRDKTVDYLKGLVDLCADLGGTSLVLGGRRLRGSLSVKEANQRGAQLLNVVGQYADSRKCFFGLEAVPAPACEFVTSLRECDDMVKQANTNGVRVHFDTGTAEMTDGNSSDDFLIDILRKTGYFQVNDFELLPPGSVRPKNHERWARLLKAAHYRKWVGIEMRPAPNPEETIRKAIHFVRSAYFMSEEVVR